MTVSGAPEKKKGSSNNKGTTPAAADASMDKKEVYNSRHSSSTAANKRSKPVFLNYHCNFTDNILPIIGFTQFACTLPFLAVQIIITQLWGLLQPKKTPQFVVDIQRSLDKYSNTGNDGEIVLWAIFLGAVLPIVWVCIGLSGSLTAAVLFNIFRIGPMYMHFAQVYTLCHMEPHRSYHLFSCGNKHPFSFLFNFWVGLFHGVLPGTFTESHISNHHKWDNGILDVYSTAGYRRDSWKSFFRYVPIWFAYASNISNCCYFAARKEWGQLYRTVMGTIYYLLFLTLAVQCFGWQFTLITSVYPFFEGNTLLALVNYTWHMFLEDDNEFVSSLTIEEGTEFIYSEEYHVVHHDIPGLHHKRYRSRFEKYEDHYDIIFEKVNLFELGITAICQNYERLAKMVKITEKSGSDRKVIAELLKTRLQHTQW